MWGSTPSTATKFTHHRSEDGTRGCEARWLRCKSSRWYRAFVCTDSSGDELGLQDQSSSVRSVVGVRRFCPRFSGRRVATEPLGDAQPYGTAHFPDRSSRVEHAPRARGAVGAIPTDQTADVAQWESAKNILSRPSSGNGPLIEGYRIQSRGRRFDSDRLQLPPLSQPAECAPDKREIDVQIVEGGLWSMPK